MIKNLKLQLLTGWHLTRWLRLVLGIALLVQAIATTDMLVGAFSVVLLFQAASNSGCCGASGCSIPENKQDTKSHGPTT